MNIAVDIILLIVGFALLVKGADFFVEGAADLARKLKIPSLVVGLTIVALGTSAPELAVSISASCSGANSMAVSNVLGSNIFNLLVVLGVCALIKPVGVTKDILKRDYPVSIIVTILFFIFLIFGNDIGRIEAGIFILLMVGYMIWTVKSALKNRTPEQETEKKFNPVKCALFIVLGAAAIVFGGNFVVDHASNLGAAMGMSETLIGLTICAIGTSLPELVTTIAAARKGETDMAMGNVIGSNIFNVLFILGMSGVISPIEIAATEVTKTLIDSGFYIAICLLAYVFCLTAKKITRVEGGILVFLYVGYTAFAIMRDTGVFAGLLPA